MVSKMQRTFYLKTPEQYAVWVEAAKAEGKSISAFLDDCVLQHIKRKRKKGITTVSDLFGKS